MRMFMRRPYAKPSPSSTMERGRGTLPGRDPSETMAYRVRALHLPFIAALLVASCGCAGGARDFARPSPNEFALGQATEADVMGRFGSPQERGRALKDGVEVMSMSYSYGDAAARASAPGVSAARAMAFYFVKGTLVGYEAISTFAADSSDFDDTRVSDIRRGVTTEAQLGELVGRPSGTYVYPLAPAPGQRVLVYAHAQKRGAAPMARKQLLVTVDAAGIVRDLQWEKIGEW